MIGRDLGDRYEILERVGGGGMALVYKAHDMVLHRTVAIKVLRQQFVGDEQFIRRFQREAQSAASLSHPNVVSIYDVGQDEEDHYIVMEYIEGENLNEKITENGPLAVETAVDIAAQICDALAHAHARGIIHRDIKPHNILIGNDGAVKVTDFGIARAATSVDITQTGAVLGSVHYFSPEHAKGISQGEQSDLYSLGIVLYQMLTNRLPFLGDSPISIALKHLQEDVEGPRMVNPDIPQSLENIILRALRKNPEERYHSADVMLQDLQSCLAEERRFEPKVTFLGDLDDQATRVMPAVRDPHDSEQLDGPRDFELSEKDLVKKKLPIWTKSIIWVAIMLIIFVGGWFGFRALANMISIPDVAVPNVIGKTLEEAKVELENANLQVDTQYETSDDVEEGRVIEQSRQDISVKENSTIMLTVSEGPQLLMMDSYVGQSMEVVQETLEQLGIDISLIKIEMRESDETIGMIIEQTPSEGTEVHPLQDELSFIVSEGPGTIAMPDLIGKTLGQVEAILTRDQLKLAEDVDYESSFTMEKGLVTRQLPANPGEPVEPGTEVSIIISDGPPDDAKFIVKKIEVEPLEEGEPSTVELTFNDVRGENQDGGTQEITEKTTFSVEVVVTPEVDATITYHIDGKFGDMETVTYRNALDDADDDHDEPTTAPEDEDEDANEEEATEDDHAKEDLDEPETENEETEDGQANDHNEEEDQAEDRVEEGTENDH